MMTRVALACVPALAIAATFEAFFSHRHDYTGHFLAGYGATLAAAAFALQTLVAKPASFRVACVLPLCAVCIALGAFTKATLFRLARFDEVDFCNQSFGAVLAAIVILPLASLQTHAPRELSIALILGIAFTGVGGCFAVA
jgi:hypothetical protein